MTETNAATTPPTGCDPKSAPWTDMKGDLWWIPSFSLDEVDRWMTLSQPQTGETWGTVADRFARQVEIVHGAIQRNHPDLTLEELRTRIAFREYDAFVTVCMRANGMAPRDPELPTGTAEGP